MSIDRQLPQPINDLWIILENITQSKHPTQRKLNKVILNFQRELQKIYHSWFSGRSIFPDTQLGEYLFLKQFKRTQAKTVFRASFSGVIYTTDRLRKLIYRRWTREGLSQRVLDDIKLLREVAFEVAPFLDEADFWVNRNDFYSGRGKRKVLYSTEIFKSSTMVFREAHYKSTEGDFVMRPTSIFLIRQALEIRLKNAFGINIVRQKDGKIVRLPFSRLLIVLPKKSKKGIQLPVSLLTIRRIYDWSNYYIHSGWLPYIWEIECSHHLLNPLFKSRKRRDGSWSLFGTVRIKKRIYENIPNMLISILKEKNSNIDVEVIRLQNPECIII